MKVRMIFATLILSLFALTGVATAQQQSVENKLDLIVTVDPIGEARSTPATINGRGEFMILDNTKGKKQIHVRIKLSSLQGASQGNVYTKYSWTRRPVYRPIWTGGYVDIVVAKGQTLWVDSGKTNGSTSATGTYQILN